MEAQCKSLPQPLQNLALLEKDVKTVSENEPKTEAKSKGETMAIDRFKVHHLKRAFKTILKTFKEDQEIFLGLKITFKQLLKTYRKEIEDHHLRRQLKMIRMA